MALAVDRDSATPLSLYVHLPWCVRKCPYCDFNSYTAGDAAPRERYLGALIRDIDQEAARADGRKLISVFLGGGTPSLFTPAEIARLLEAVSCRFGTGEGVEITMEANPGTVECGDPAGYREAGVNRLSIGAQSFDAEALEALGRIHTVQDIGRAVADAREAGFDNINVDLMYGLPGQSAAAAIDDIEQAVRLAPTHLSWYQLTLEPNTVFYARPPAGMPDDELSYEIQQRGQQRLAELGFTQYEVSAYAREGRRSAHNLNYWTFGDYLAVGAGAHGKLSNADGIWRYVKPVHPKQYMESLESGSDAARLRPLQSGELLFEFMLNVLRLTDAFDASLFRERTRMPATMLRERLAAPVTRGLVAARGEDRWQVTPLGRRFLNDLQAEFLPG